MTKKEKEFTKELLLVVLKHYPGLSGSKIWSLIKQILTEEDQDCRKTLAEMEKEGLVYQTNEISKYIRNWYITEPETEKKPKKRKVVAI